MATMQEIEQLTRRLAEQRERLAEVVGGLRAEVDALQRQALPTIRRRVAAAMDAQATLSAAIDGSRELFDQPRTVVFAGVKVGLQKRPGRLVFDDPDKLVELIRKRLPGDVDRLVKVTYTPLKSALAKLPAPELARIGATLIDTGDAVVVAPADDEVDQMVAALLKDHLQELEQ